MSEDKSIANLSAPERSTIEEAVRQAALDHVNAKDAQTALSHYNRDATVVSNGIWFDSFDSFARDTYNFFESLKEVKLAVWDEVRIQVISSKVALFTGKVRWESVDNSGRELKLKGVWSAVYVRENGKWKISLRHESFED